jgi:hypothetical protein
MPFNLDSGMKKMQGTAIDPYQMQSNVYMSKKFMHMIMIT